jgi:Response regulator containing a CheY-like receiver domain and an HTH DNA-binding domain
MSQVRILIADDHELVRDGIKARLEKQAGWVVCGEASTGREALTLAEQLRPDVAVLDIGMAELNGIEAAAQIRKRCPDTEVLMLTLQDSEQQVLAALAAGAKGFILKTDASRLLVDAIDALLRREPFLSGKIAGQVLNGYLSPTESRPPLTRLTSREREIVQLLAEAKTNKDVARILGVSVKTVDAHRSNIMRKLNLHSVAELVRFAIRNRIIDA